MGRNRVPLIVLIMTVVLLGSVMAVGASPVLDRARPPYETAETSAYCNGVGCSYEVSADAASGLVLMALNATASHGEPAGGATWATIGHSLHLAKPIPWAVLEIVLDVDIATEVGGEAGRADTSIDLWVYTKHAECCYGIMDFVLADNNKDCNYCDDLAPERVGRAQQTLLIPVFDWDGDDLLVGDYGIELLFEGRASAARGEDQQDAVSVLGVQVTQDEESPGNVSASYEATIAVVSMALKEVAEEKSKKAPPSRLRHNHTFEIVPPFEQMFINPGCYDGCQEASGDNATGAFFARKQFPDIPSTSEVYQRDQSVEFTHTVDFPYGADSARLTGQIRIDEATAQVSDASGNGYAYVAIEAFMVKWDCGSLACRADDRQVVVAEGPCSACAEATNVPVRDGTVALDLTLVDPAGTMSPGEYRIVVTARAVAKPSTMELAPGRTVATSGATAQADGLFESLTLEIDPAEWP